jgi:hypothetical protein
MNNKITKLTSQTEIETSESFGNTYLEGVRLNLESSSSRADAFNTAIKLSALDWTDPVIVEVNELIDERLLELRNPKTFKITYENSGKINTYYMKAKNKSRARHLFNMKKYKLDKIVKVEEVKESKI